MEDLSEAEDTNLRAYARWLDPDRGEDAYQIAMLDAVEKGVFPSIREPLAFFRHAIKLAFYKILRHEKAEHAMVECFLEGAPSPAMVNLAKGRQPRTMCKREHPLVEGNLAYIKDRRTCLTCLRIRSAARQRAMTARRKEVTA